MKTKFKRKYMKRIILAVISLVLIFGITGCEKDCTCVTEKTLTLQPGNAEGQDATTFDTQGCSSGAQYANNDNVNFGSIADYHAMAWTYNALGCATGQVRSYIKFTGLDVIPANAEIISAKLYLYGVPSSNSTPEGNSTYPGSPYESFGSNECWLKRVTANWSESTITWNNQPATTSDNEVSVPASTSKWNFDVLNLDVTNMVKAMINTSGANHGFCLMLKTEQYYRNLGFASSDHADASKHPKLIVVYKS